MRRTRLRPTLKLRLLLLLILAFGLWLGREVNRARHQHLAVAEIERYNGHVDYDYEFKNSQEIPSSRRWAPQWLRHRIGEEFFQEVTQVIYVDQPISDATLAPLDGLDGIEELWILTRMHHTLRECAGSA